ncbi:sulfur oxidation c-type cytochrome SoxX [Ramlibacter sp.]|uniref:sulfur oxidation c-type cytochrome SoxX n=1 Tax=Ramlibacter sp. TaxID=1917967 RepID=UPI003D0DE53E
MRDLRAWGFVLALFAAVPAAAEGDPVRGRAIVANRQVGLCLLCHRAPIPEERFQGDLGPDLAGVGSRYTTDMLRQRIAQSPRDSIMPAYLRSDGFERVGAQWRGRPILTPQQVDDVAAYLSTLK